MMDKDRQKEIFRKIVDMIEGGDLKAVMLDHYDNGLPLVFKVSKGGVQVVQAEDFFKDDDKSIENDRQSIQAGFELLIERDAHIKVLDKEIVKLKAELVDVGKFDVNQCKAVMSKLWEVFKANTDVMDFKLSVPWPQKIQILFDMIKELKDDIDICKKSRELLLAEIEKLKKIQIPEDWTPVGGVSLKDAEISRLKERLVVKDKEIVDLKAALEGGTSHLDEKYKEIVELKALIAGVCDNNCPVRHKKGVIFNISVTCNIPGQIMSAE